MDEIRLVIPMAEHEAAARAFAEEVISTDSDGIHGSSYLREVEYSVWLDNIKRSAVGEAREGLSPADTHFGIRVSDGAIVGITNLRFRLDSEFMQKFGGHIGYTVRPTERGRGYAKQMLKMMLDRCREQGIYRVLITYDPENAALYRTIEACGGIMENELPYPGTDELVRRYWIELN